MKWQIVPEHRHEFSGRGPRAKGGARGSSAPTSPAKDGSRTVAGSSSQIGGPDQSQDAHSQSKHSPRSTTPPLSSYPVAANEAYTPDRGPQNHQQLPPQHGHGATNGLPDLSDTSPLPSRSRAYGLSDTAAATGSPTPLLSSSYYNDDSRSSLVTPAPRRQNPKLAPPSTAHLPSTYMPTSSPAPFWKFADDGSTPARPMPDLSPLKTGGRDGGVNLQSSSPPHAGESGSPTRVRNGPFPGSLGSSQMRLGTGLMAHDVDDDEGGGIDLARYGVTSPAAHNRYQGPV